MKKESVVYKINTIVVVPLAVLSLAAGGYFAMKMTAPAPEQKPPPRLIPSVRVARASAGEVQLTVKSQGAVRPRYVTELTAEINGKLVFANPALKKGGVFKKGEVLARIDDRDYDLASENAEAQLVIAEAALVGVRAEAEQAMADWVNMGKVAGDAPPLVKRSPQLAEAEARIAVARAALDQARLNLERTKMIAPFDGCSLGQKVEEGQYVMNGASIARFYSLEFAEVALPLSREEMGRIEMGVPGESDAYPRVEFTAQFGDKKLEWEGYVEKTEGEFDERSRLIHVVAVVEGGFSSASFGGGMMKPGLFVEARIEGRREAGVIELPRSVLREGGKIHVIDDQGRLRVREVRAVESGDEKIIVRSGLSEGEFVCLTPLSIVVDGMEVRVEEGGRGGEVDKADVKVGAKLASKENE